MSDKIPRFKSPADFTAEDYFHLQRTGQRPENPEWVTRRAEALADADLEDDSEVTDPKDMTPAQHLKRLQGAAWAPQTVTHPIENPRFIFSGGGGISGDILLADSTARCPKEVETANTNAVTAFDKYHEAERQYRHAREEARIAPSLDASADAAATAVGERFPSSAPRMPLAKRCNSPRADSKQPGQTPADAQTVLAKVIAKHKAAWQGEQDAVVAVVAGECRDLVASAPSHSPLSRRSGTSRPNSPSSRRKVRWSAFAWSRERTAHRNTIRHCRASGTDRPAGARQHAAPRRTAERSGSRPTMKRLARRRWPGGDP